jgi:hypothetical protein
VKNHKITHFQSWLLNRPVSITLHLTLPPSTLAWGRKRLWLITMFPLLFSPILSQVWNFTGSAVITNHGTIPCCFGLFINEVCYLKACFPPCYSSWLLPYPKFLRFILLALLSLLCLHCCGTSTSCHCRCLFICFNFQRLQSVRRGL